MWLIRERVFDYDNNKYYTPNGKFNTWSAKNDIAMPNCTMYAFLRMQEETEQTEKQDTWIRSEGGFGHAKEWWTTTTLSKGYNPKVGAIAVFDGNCGHVSIVEKVIDDTHVVISESVYDDDKSLRNWRFWRTREVNLVVGKATLSGIGKLLGYIYPPINDIRVDRDTSKDQIEITENLVNVRQEPTTSAPLFATGLYCPEGIFNVIEFKEADGYTWAKLDDKCWVACGSWANIYKAEEQEEEQELDLSKTVQALTESLKKVKTQLAQLEKENKELTEKASTLEKEVNKLNNKIDEAKAISENLTKTLNS